MLPTGHLASMMAIYSPLLWIRFGYSSQDKCPFSHPGIALLKYVKWNFGKKHWILAEHTLDKTKSSQHVLSTS